MVNIILKFNSEHMNIIRFLDEYQSILNGYILYLDMWCKYNYYQTNILKNSTTNNFEEIFAILNLKQPICNTYSSTHTILIVVHQLYTIIIAILNRAKILLEPPLRNKKLMVILKLRYEKVECSTINQKKLFNILFIFLINAISDIRRWQQIR